MRTRAAVERLPSSDDGEAPDAEASTEDGAEERADVLICPECGAEMVYNAETGAEECPACGYVGDAAIDETDGDESADPERGADDDDPERDAPRVLMRTALVTFDAAAAAARAASGQPADDRIPISFSSEQPVLRTDWWENERYLEVLDHAATAVDMRYAADGLPFLVEHDRSRQVGIVEDIAFAADRVGRGMLRLSRSPEGQQIGQDIRDGIRRRVSFGYTTSDNYDQTGGDEEGSTPTRRYTRWTPMEVSTVSIPADVTVGPGRTAGSPSRRRRPSHRPAPQATEFPMPQNGTAAPSGAAPTRAGAPPAVGRDYAAELREIRRLCRAANVDEATEDGFLERGFNPDQVRQALWDGVISRAQSMAAGSPGDRLGISEGERREYSLGRALQALVNNDWRNAGYEREVSQQLSQRLGRGTNGILVSTELPTNLRTPMTVGTAGNGGNTVPAQMASTLIELLRNKSVIDRLGPMRLPGLQGNIPLPRQTAAGTAAWRAENPGADVAESNMTFDQVTLSPKNILAMERYSKQLFAQSIFAIDSLVREDLTTILSLLYDAAAVGANNGGANDITGLYALAGVGTEAFGGTVTYAHAVGMETTADTANAILGSSAYVGTTGVKGKAKQTLEFAVNGASKLWTGGDDGEMNGYRAVATNQLPVNLGAGTNEHGLLFGSWNQAIVADWGAIDITVDPYTNAGQAMVRVIAHWLADFNVRHPAAFVKATGLIP